MRLVGSLAIVSAIVLALGVSAGAFAQDKPAVAPAEAAQTAQPGQPAPQPGAPATSAPATAPEGEPAPGETPPAAPEAPAEPEPEPAPTPAPAPAPQQEPPPPPAYGELGGEPEPEIQEGEWDPWEHATPYDRHHEGFYLRLSIGLGVGSATGDGHIDRTIDEVTLSGFGLGTSIGIGGALVDNLILYGDIFSATMFDPDVERDGVEIESDFEARNVLGVGDDLRLAGVGIGLCYYFMPVNIYLSGSVGFGQAVFEDDRGDVVGSDWGFATNLMFGKEWWVGTDWGLGLAGQFILVSAEDDILGDVTGLALNMMFSATYN